MTEYIRQVLAADSRWLSIETGIDVDGYSYHVHVEHEREHERAVLIDEAAQIAFAAAREVVATCVDEGVPFADHLAQALALYDQARRSR